MVQVLREISPPLIDLYVTNIFPVCFLPLIFISGSFSPDVCMFFIIMSSTYQYFLLEFLPLFKIFQNKIDVAIKEAPSFKGNL